MLTRKYYLDGNCTHAEYYNQVIKIAGIKLDVNHRLVQRCKNSTDEHYNDTGLKIWDDHAPVYQLALSKAFNELGDSWSMAGNVCVLKQAVRNVLNQ